MKGVLDIQRRGQQAGRIRIGQQVPTGKTGRDGKEKTRPARLDTFRLTTQSRQTAVAVAELLGGTVRAWNNELEVITDRSELAVTVPPRDQVVSQWYEMWSAGGCQRRCDSQTEQISGGPCLCPHAANPADEDEVARKALERADLAKLNPPRACKLVTRISVMIPDLPGLGVWRLDTGSYYAGVEIGDAAQLMEMARDRGVFLPAILRIEQRRRVAGGETKKYPVPVLEVLATFRQIASGELEAGGITAQLPPAPGEPRKAITAGATDLPRPGSKTPPGGGDRVAGPGQPTTADMSRPRDAAPQTSGSTTADGPALTRDPAADPGPGHPLDEDAQYVAAQWIADRAAAAVTADQFKALGQEMHAAGCADVYVCTDRASDEHEQLRDYLLRLWDEKAGEAK